MRSVPLLALVVLVTAACPAPDKPHPYPVRDCSSSVRFKPSASLDAVTIRGEWNAFAGDAMTKQDDGSFAFTSTLAPRDYAYAFDLSGARQLDEANPYRRYVSNDEYSLLRVEDCSQPQLRLDAFTQPASGKVHVQAQFVDGSGDRRSVKGASVGYAVSLDGAERSDATISEAGAITFDADGLANGKHTIRITATDDAGRPTNALYLPFWIEDEPFDWQEAILYFAFTDRFANGDTSNDAPVADVDAQANYAGGDWKGITQKIDAGYFDGLGVRAIWISPVQANPDEAFPGTGGHLYTGYHGYWPTKGREPQKRFGSLDDLRALTTAAHAHGIRVITDLVINHVHSEHEYYLAHKNDGWFNTGNQCVCGESNCDWDVRRLDCWFTSYLPDLNWRSPQASDQLVADALWWIEEGDLDGFRLDAVKHVDHLAGRAIAGRLNEIGRATGIDYYLVGETFTGVEGRPLISEYIGPNELDGQFDFPLYWSIVDGFAKGGSLKAVDDAVLQDEQAYPPGTLNSPFIGNHDVPRFASIAANQIEADAAAQAWGNKPPPTITDDLAFQRTRDALTFALTLPGVPLIYYGDELGMPGTGDPDNRRMMRFDAQLSAREAALLEHVKKVGEARRHNRGLRYGARYTLSADVDTLVYQRDDAASDDGAIVTIHRTNADETKTVTLKGRLKDSNGLTLTDVISGRTATITNGTLALPLPAASAGVWIPR